MKKHWLLFGALLLQTVACEKKPVTPTPEPPAQIPISISAGVKTKVTDTAYEARDVVGLYVVNQGSELSASGNQATNEAFTYSGGQWTPARQLYWKDSKTTASFYCYYPHTASISDPLSVPFAVQQDQSSESGYKASELLWGSSLNVSPTSSAVAITTTHRMSAVFIYLNPGTGYSAETLWRDNPRLVLTGLRTHASLNLKTGEVSASGSAQEIIPLLEGGDHFRALVPPQSVNKENLLRLEIGGESFNFAETIEFKSNTQHTITLTVYKVSQGIDVGIGAWEVDGQDYGGTVN